jgi:hypothetical protein
MSLSDLVEIRHCELLTESEILEDGGFGGSLELALQVLEVLEQIFSLGLIKVLLQASF